MSLLGVDVGTTGCSATTFSVEGASLAGARQPYNVIAGPSGMLELDSRAVWNAACRAIREVAARTRQDPIRALSVSSIGEAMVPVSAEGLILGNCIVGPDERTAKYARRVERSLGTQRFFEVTGNVVDGPCSLGNLCWLRENDPHLFASAWRFLPLGTLICHLLGGMATCDYSLASRTFLFDVGRKEWSRDLLRICDLPKQKLPNLAPAGTLVGTISPIKAQDLGLPPKVRLVLGGHDQCSTALGSGVVENGMAGCGLGGRISVTPSFNAIPLTSLMLTRGLSMERHLVPDLFMGLFYDRSGGSILKWFAHNLAPLERRQARRRGASVYDVLLAEMPEEPTRLMALPHFGPSGPPYFDEKASGAILGLDTETTRGQIIRALLEGMTYRCAEGHLLFEEAGIRIRLYRATGGGARSQRWLQLVADVLGVPVERTQVVNPSALGAALVAGVGSGTYASFEEAAEVAVHVEKSFVPDANRYTAYQVRLGQYHNLYPLLRDQLHHLHDL